MDPSKPGDKFHKLIDLLPQLRKLNIINQNQRRRDSKLETESSATPGGVMGMELLVELWGWNSWWSYGDGTPLIDPLLYFMHKVF